MKKANSGAEAKLVKTKEAVEEAKIVLYNARFDFRDAKKAFLAEAKAHSKKVLHGLTKKGK